ELRGSSQELTTPARTFAALALQASVRYRSTFSCEIAVFEQDQAEKQCDHAVQDSVQHDRANVIEEFTRIRRHIPDDNRAKVKIRQAWQNVFEELGHEI